MRKLMLFISLLLVFFVNVLPAFAGRHERREAAIAESGKAQTVTGGAEFQVPEPSEKAFDAILTYFQGAGYALEPTMSSRDLGQIVTAMVIEKGRFGKQTGTRVQVSLVKNGTVTTVRVAVSEQSRRKLLQAEPWSDPKISFEESQRVADALKAKFLSASVAAN